MHQIGSAEVVTSGVGGAHLIKLFAIVSVKDVSSKAISRLVHFDRHDLLERLILNIILPYNQNIT